MKQKTRQKCEIFFSNIARRLYRHHKKTIGLTFAFIFILASFIPKAVIDTSAVALLRQTDPARIAYDKFREQFDKNDIIVIAVTPDKVFDKQFLSRLKSFHQDLENEVPFLKEVTSLINGIASRPWWLLNTFSYLSIQSGAPLFSVLGTSPEKSV